MDFLLLIATGQLSLLILAGLRRASAAYPLWLAAMWTWITAAGLCFFYLPQASLYVVLLYPFVLRALLLRFFEKPLPKFYPLHILPPLAVGITGYLLPALSPVVVSIYLAYEGVLLIRLLGHLLVKKGASLFGNAGKKISWLRLMLLFSLLLVALVLFHQWIATVYVSYLVPPVMLLVAGFSAWFFSQDEAWTPLTSENKYPGSTLDQVEKFRILTSLETQLNEKGYALDPAASLAGLARKVQATPHQLSQVINESKGMGFFELMAWHRVQEAKKLLRNPAFSHLKIEEIGERVGYLSKSSFNTVFKKYTGRTPSGYRDGEVRKHDVERANHKNVLDHYLAGGTFGSLQNTSVMFSNFIKIYFRSLARNRSFTFINVTGLVAGLASALLIWLYLQHELSYDTFHHRAEDIHRIAFMSRNPQTRTAHPMAQAMVAEFPEVEAAVSLSPLYGPGLTKQSMYIRNPEKDVMFREPDGYAADSTFFQVFDFELLIGNKETALKETGGLIISESLAKKYFGDENPLGKILEIDTDGHPIMVTGIMKDVPASSHFHPNFILSYVTLKYMNPEDAWFQWADYGHFNYIKLRSGADAQALAEKLPHWLYRLGQLTDEWYAGFESGEVRFELQPITDIHLKSHIRWELEANGNIIYIYILFASIGFILVIASINFINLSTARAFERAKEVGVRRTLGAGKRNISIQFVSESIFTCLLSLLLAYGVALLAFDGYQQLTGKAFSYAALIAPSTLLLAISLTILIGLISGLFPAVTVSRIKPGEVLKGKFVTGSKSEWLRKSLLVVQFAVSAILIFGSVILVVQVRYMEGIPLGYNDNRLLAVELKSRKVVNSLEALKSEIRKVPGVSTMGAVSNLPGTQFNQHPMYADVQVHQFADVSQIKIDFDGHTALELELVDGRWFDPSSGLDSLGKSYILNETAALAMGLTSPIGSKLFLKEDNGIEEGYVVGITKDFHFQSLHVPIQPLLIELDQRNLNFLLVKLDSGNVQQALEQIEKIYAGFDDKFGFEAFFLDQKNQQLYEAEKRALGIFNLFAGIALFLASLGLIGLAYLMIVQRTKEIGIRKILGASIPQILWKQNQVFLKLIVFALALGFPVAYFIMSEWLASFVYRVSIGWVPFLITLLIVSGIAVFSVTVAILRTVLANPSEALRYE